MIDLSNCKLTKYPAEILRKKALPVEKIDESIVELAEKMIDMMIEENGIGLAAPQANVSLRMFVISLEGNAEDAIVFINPEIKTYGSIEAGQEGCLSVPGIYTNIKRPSKVTVKALGLDGKEFVIEADELLARCIQHEYDHLEGKTIVDKMTTIAKIKHRRAVEALIEDYKSSQAG
ncbi:MAG: peptide deformylase [Sedimentisphaeraceae bacterium JB056]